MRQTILTITFCCLFIPAMLSAGGSPETTLLVVNADSPLSLTIANHYVKLRKIPENNLVWLHNIPSLGNIEMQTFRERIWRPIRQFMEKQGIYDHIDTIVYSADFPYAVRLRDELTRHQIPAHDFIGGYASLTGLTFFARQVENNRVDYLSLYPNGYYRRDLARNITLTTKLLPDEKLRQDQARSDLRQGKYQQAHDVFLSLSNKYPDQTLLIMELAEAQAGLRQWDPALESLRRLVRLGFKNSLWLRNNRHLKGLHKSREFREITKTMETPSSRFELPHGFHSRYHWARRSIALSYNSIDRYYLSSMLAYTGQRGNSLDEIKHYLQRSMSSDGTRPNGTVYLMENGDVRAEARQPWFSETCALLRQIGRNCEILSPGSGSKNGILPFARKNIIGLTAGTRSFDWEASGNTLLPGAIADSFTSWGGDFNNPRQTKLTEFLRQGASGSSGAVTEPYSFPEKFPLPLMHYYYASGCSLAESWYQAVASPYQALLVADPLTQPFVSFAQIELTSPDPQTKWSGEVQLETKIHPKGEGKIVRLELWVDGIPVKNITPGEPLIWDTRTVDDGYHDLRIVAEEDGLIQTRTGLRHGISVLNHGSELTIKAQNSNPTFHEPIMLSGKATDDDALIEIYQGQRKLGETRTNNREWSIDIPTESLGMGVVNLTAKAATSGSNPVQSRPVKVDIQPPTSIPSNIDHALKYPGLVASIKYTGEPTEYKLVQQLNGNFQNLTKDKTTLESVQIDGEFRVETAGFYQIVIDTKGKIEVSINGKMFKKNAPERKHGTVYVPVSLQQGWHRISIKPHPSGMDGLTLLLSGGQAPTILGGDQVRNNILPKKVEESSAHKK